MRRQQCEGLVIDGREDVVLRDQFVDRDHADDLVLDPQRNRGQRAIERRLAIAEIKTLAASRNAAQDPFTQMRPDALDAGHGVLAVAGDRAQLVGVFIEQKEGERLRADDVDDDVVNDLYHFPKVERGVQLITRDVQRGEIVVLVLDLGVAAGVVLVLFLQGAETLPQPLVLPQQLLGEVFALVEQLEKLLSSRLVAHRSQILHA